MPDALIPIGDAKLPQNYIEAVAAIQRVVDIDEVKQWADKSAALASYARQLGDRQAEVLFQKIRARAKRRMGQILRDMPSGRGANQHTKEEDGGDAPTKRGRLAAAKAAGISRDQAIEAIAIAGVPDGTFEDAVERDRPLPLSVIRHLIEDHGRRRRDLGTRLSEARRKKAEIDSVEAKRPGSTGAWPTILDKQIKDLEARCEKTQEWSREHRDSLDATRTDVEVARGVLLEILVGAFDPDQLATIAGLISTVGLGGVRGFDRLVEEIEAEIAGQSFAGMKEGGRSRPR